MTATSASVRFSASGVTGVDAFVRLTGQSFIHCCVYDDIAPILAVKGGRPGLCRAGGVMAAQTDEEGRPELVPPAAPGFSPVCTKEVTRLCARS
jgi:hypothetical protein